MTEDSLTPAAQLRLTTSRSAYRRAGLVIGSTATPTLLSPEQFHELGKHRQLRLLADPAIEIAASEDGVAFKRLSIEDRELAVSQYHEFMTGTGEEGGAEGQAPLEPSLASDAAAATGDDGAGAGTASTDGGNVDAHQPAADPAPAPVAAPASEPEKPSGRAPKAAKPKASEAKAAS